MPNLANLGILALAVTALAADARAAWQSRAADLELETAPGADRDRTEAPYFVTGNGQPGIDQLPLKFTHVEVDIAGVIAQVRVNQVYANEGSEPIEAIYLFPASTRAAVHALRMTVGDRLIEAQIRERRTARRDYEQAVTSGQTASLLEQERPNVFRMSVGNIQPGDTVNVEIDYTELLVPTERRYEFVFPTTVGPRYTRRPDDAENAAAPSVAGPHLRSGQPAAAGFDLLLRIASAVPIADVQCNHDVAIDQPDERHVEVALTPDQARHRDFVLRYGLAGREIESGLMLYPGSDENFFLFMIEPPERIAPEAVLPREYLFVLDVSGSMRGYPLGTTKQLMRELLGSLTERDSFDIVTFSGGHDLLAPRSLPVTDANIRAAMRFVDAQEGGGGTELVAALERALELPRVGRSARIVVLASDGFVDVEKQAFTTVRANLGDANLFAFGIGTSVNRYLIEGLARAGMGEPFVVDQPAAAAEQVARFRRYVAAPLLTNVAVTFDGFDAYDVVPAEVPDLFAERPVVVFGKYRGAPSGTIRLTGRAAGHPVSGHFEAADGLLSPQHVALRQLWARHRVAELADDEKLAGDDHARQQLVELGLCYNLLTDHTSFVAIDRSRRGSSKPHAVRQPQNLPDGVSDAAVDGIEIERTTERAPARVQSFHGAGYKVSGLQSADVPRFSTFGGAPQQPQSTQSSTAGLASLLRVGGGSGGVRAAIGLKQGQVTTEGTRSQRGSAVVASRSPRARGQGYLDRSVIQQVVNKNIGQIQFCYEKTLLKQPGLAGKIVLEWTIGRGGRVKSVKVVRSTLGSPEVANCAATAVKGWRFPAPHGGDVVVTYPFLFRSIGL